MSDAMRRIMLRILVHVITSHCATCINHLLAYTVRCVMYSARSVSMETPVLKITDFGLSMSELECGPPSMPPSATASPTARSHSQSQTQSHDREKKLAAAAAAALTSDSTKTRTTTLENSFGFGGGDRSPTSGAVGWGGTAALGPGPYTACRGCSMAYASPEVEAVLGRMRDMGVGALETDGVSTSSAVSHDRASEYSALVGAQ